MIHYRFSQSWKHFNTSHVNVNLNAQGKKAQRLLNFNTSHVNVNLAELLAQRKARGFQYISC